MADHRKEFDSYESRIQTYKQELVRLNKTIKEFKKLEQKYINGAKDAEERYNEMLLTIPEVDKKISDRKKELVSIEQCLADTKVYVSDEMAKLDDAKEKISANLAEIEEQKLELDRQIKSYQEMISVLVDERREVGLLREEVNINVNDTVKVQKEWKRKCAEIEGKARELNNKVTEYDNKIADALTEKNNYEALVKVTQTEKRGIDTMKKQLDEEIRAYGERNAELFIAETDVQSREKIANDLKLSFEKQIEALDEKETKLEIFKLKLNKEAKKLGMEKELAELKKA